MAFSFDAKNVQGHYILGPDGEPIAEPDLMKWAEWFENAASRRIAYEKINDHVFVSTVFLGIDYRFGGDGPPILWETMVFTDDKPEDMVRYSSRAAAIEGHEKLVAEWRANIKWPTFG